MYSVKHITYPRLRLILLGILDRIPFYIHRCDIEEVTTVFLIIVERSLATRVKKYLMFDVFSYKGFSLRSPKFNEFLCGYAPESSYILHLTFPSCTSYITFMHTYICISPSNCLCICHGMRWQYYYATY